MEAWDSRLVSNIDELYHYSIIWLLGGSWIFTHFQLKLDLSGFKLFSSCFEVSIYFLVYYLYLSSNQNIWTLLCKFVITLIVVQVIV